MAGPTKPVQRLTILFCMAAFMSLTGCDSFDRTPVVETMSGAGVKRVHDAQLIAMGEEVYLRHCRGCHGANGEGAENWRQKGPDGRYPPPPLNGSGHAWHHPNAVLIDIITNGSAQGQGNMPAWGDKLSSDEIRAVIAWFQSQWPDQVYAAWYDMEQRSYGR